MSSFIPINPPVNGHQAWLHGLIKAAKNKAAY